MRYDSIETNGEQLTVFRDNQRTKCLLVGEVVALLNEREELLSFVKGFTREWEATWVDPDEVNHEWSELYKAAKQLVRESSGGHVAKPESEAQP